MPARRNNLYLIYIILFSSFAQNLASAEDTQQQTNEENCFYYVKNKAVEKNSKGGFRPKWILVNPEGEYLDPGALIDIIETRTMIHDPDIVITRYLVGTVGDNGRLIYHWHWRSGYHLKFAHYEWQLDNDPKCKYKYLSGGDILKAPYKNLNE